MSKPLVSICCLTYNHAPFIRQCLEGFLMQEPPTGVDKDEPWFEILIHDDCSTDGTAEIVKEYVAKYPDRIFPLYEEKNMYQNGMKGKMDTYNYNRAQGKYFACCEGDDYWTDPLKLQKQVDFMESHPDFSVCFTRWRGYRVAEDKYEDDSCGHLFANHEKGIEITKSLYFKKWITQPLTMLFRASDYNPQWREQYTLYRDIYEIYHLLNEGKGYLLADVTGQYNRHDGGIFSQVNMKVACETELIMARELYQCFNDKETKENLVRVLQWNIDSHRQIGANKYKLTVELLGLNGNVRKFIKNLLR